MKTIIKFIIFIIAVNAVRDIAVALIDVFLFANVGFI